MVYQKSYRSLYEKAGGVFMKIVLHICCGVCAAGVAERLIREEHFVLGFFYNPNIHLLEEYQRRLEVARTVARKMGFPLEVAPYVPEKWFEKTAGLENEPEGGTRCQVCFRLRLEKTYLFMKERGGDAFTTTLTVSPHKSAAVINQVGQEIGEEKFLARDFKKQEGFKRTMALAREWTLYRQDYCGCIYSMRQS
jgi:predicted adenine nucleotide alpha hydrolase (AANH) superfamily ATPase